MASRGLVLLTALDLGTYGLSYAVWPHTLPIAAIRRQNGHDPPDPVRGRIVAAPSGQRSPVARRQPSAAGRIPPADGYAGLVPRERLDYREADAAQCIAGVGLAMPGDGDLGRRRLAPVIDPLPTIRLVTRAILAGDGPLPAEALAADAALVERAARICRRSEPGNAERSDRARPGAIESTTDAPTRATVGRDRKLPSRLAGHGRRPAGAGFAG